MFTGVQSNFIDDSSKLHLLEPKNKYQAESLQAEDYSTLLLDNNNDHYYVLSSSALKVSLAMTLLKITFIPNVKVS